MSLASGGFAATTSNPNIDNVSLAQARFQGQDVTTALKTYADIEAQRSKTALARSLWQSIGGGHSGSSWGNNVGSYSPIDPVRLNAFLGAIAPSTNYEQIRAQARFTPDELAQYRPNIDIDTGPIWDDYAVGSQLNNMRSITQGQADAAARDASRRFASSGFSANSPAAQAVRSNIDAQRIAADLQNETGLRWDVATGNAAYKQQGQTSKAQIEQDYLQALLGAETDRQGLLLNAYQDDRNARLNLLAGLFSTFGGG